MQRTIAVDSQIVNSMQSCELMTHNRFVRHIEPQSKAEPLEKGDLIHKSLEVYYNLKGPKDLSNDMFQELVRAGVLKTSDIETTEHSKIVKLALDTGYYYGTKMEIGPDTVEEVLGQFREYCKFYEHDNWHPLAVENVGAKLLFESEEFRFIYIFKIDLVAEKGHIIAPWDHKTGARNSTPSSMSNQFIGYCYGLDLEHIIINKIGFQKTLSPAQRFLRYTLNVSQARIAEWQRNTIKTVLRYVECLDSGEWNMNLTSCDKFSGCIYHPLCESDPDSREWKIERNYKIGKPWDPAKELEAKPLVQIEAAK